MKTFHPVEKTHEKNKEKGYLSIYEYESIQDYISLAA